MRIDRKHIDDSRKASRVVEQKKKGKISFGSGVPRNVEGSDGDTTIRQTINGKFSYIKVDGVWLSSPLFSDAQAGMLSSLINTNTNDADFLIYDNIKKQYINKNITGDIQITKDGTVKLRDHAVTSNTLADAAVISKNIGSNIIEDKHIKLDTIDANKLNTSTGVAAVNVFTMSAGSSLDVAGGVKATGTIQVDSQPSVGTSSTGTITPKATKGYLPYAGSTLTIDDGFYEHIFEFYTGSYDGKHIGVLITSDNPTTTMTALRTAINAVTQITADAPHATTYALALTSNTVSAGTNNTITQSSDAFTLAGMSGGANGSNFQIPGLKEGTATIYITDTTTSDKIDPKTLKSYRSDKNTQFINRGANTTATSVAIKEFFDTSYGNGLGLTATNPGSDRITFTNQENRGTAGNGSFVVGDASLSVVGNMAGGVDRTAKYIILSRPREENETVIYSDGGTNSYGYVDTIVYFDVDTDLLPPDVVTPVTAVETIEVNILSSDSAATVAGKFETAVEAFFITTDDGTTVNPYSVSVATAAVTITCATKGATNTLNFGTSGMSLTSSVTGRWYLGALSDINYSPAITALNNATVNELVTVGATTTELDAESLLTFDGGQLDITNTNALKSHLKLLYNGSNFCIFFITTQGDLQITTSGDNGEIFMSADDRIAFKADGEFAFVDGSAKFGEFDTTSASNFTLKSSSNYNLNLQSQGTGDVNIDSNDDVSITAVDDITIRSADTLTLRSDDGTFVMSKGATEFSAANSAYAGMILGYTSIQNLDNDAGDNTITIGNTFAVLETVAGTKPNISFVAPPSGNVEIIFSAACYALSKSFYFSLSDNATYNEYNEIHTYDGLALTTDESDKTVATIRWTVTGLTAGTSYQFWIGARCSSASGYIYHGESERFGNHSPPIIVKAVALPATIVTGE